MKPLSSTRYITRKRVRLRKNEYQIRNQRKKLPLSQKFHVKTPRNVPFKLEGGGQGKLQQRHAHSSAAENLPQKQSQFSQNQNVDGNSSGSSQSNNDLTGQQSMPHTNEAIINRRGHSVDDLTLHAIRKDSKDSNTDTVGAFNFISENQLVAQNQRKHLMLSKNKHIGQESASTTAVEEFPAPDSESGDLNELIRNGSGAKGVDTSFDSLNTTSFDSTKILTHLKLE